MLAPFWKSIKDISTENCEAQIIVHLPVFRLFTRKAQVGILAHEFAHAVRAKKIGRGWHENMQARYLQEERLADSIAKKWGFKSEIQTLRAERKLINPLLEAKVPKILARAEKRMAADYEAARARFGDTSDTG
jgi:hypothetical protein